MIGKSLLLILSSVVYVSSLNVTLLKSYDAKTCKNEPSCDLVNDPALPADRRTLRRRPCMCDADCVIYRDCCADSKYYNELEQSRPPTFYCQPTYKVYLKTTCPETWTDEEVRSKCSLSKSALRSDDISLIVPVTNTIKNITYGNKYCAICHADTDFRPWVLSPLCGEAPPGLLLQQSTLLPESITVLSTSTLASLPLSTSISTILPLSLVTAPVPSPSTPASLSTPVILLAPSKAATRTQRMPLPSFEYSVSSPTSKIKFRRSRSSDLLSNKGMHESRDANSEYSNSFMKYRRHKRANKIQVDFYKYIKYVNDIWKTAKYDPHSGYFVTKFLEKDIICTAYSKLSSNLKPFTRPCVPNIIETCSETPDPDTDKQCRSHTSLVFNKRNNKAYRNKYCATCDGAESNYLTGCPIMVRDEGVPTLAIYL